MKKKGIKPNISCIRVFGSTIYYKTKGPDSHSKLKARANKAVLIGYTDNAKVYKLWDIELRKVVYSRDVEILRSEERRVGKECRSCWEVESSRVKIRRME